VQVTEVVERFEDGRFVVIVEGLERFRLDRETEGRSFRTGEVEVVQDRDDRPTDDTRAEAITLFEELRDAVGAEVETPDRDDPELAWAIAARVEVDLQTKQLLLESPSERERLELVVSHLRSASAQIELLREQSALVRRNGNLRGAAGESS
jgi:Lon protease-like protein